MQRDRTLDFVKAIGIFLVVLGHAACPSTYVNHFIYSCHMPLFFMASGYFFNPKYIHSKREFTIKKVKDIYVPFLKWSLLFLLLHNLFLHLGVLSTQFGNSGGGVSKYYSWHTMYVYAKNILLKMSGYEPFLLGGYWFMRALFVSSIVFCLGTWLMNLITRDSKRAIIAVTLLAFAGGYAVMQHKIPGFPQGGYRDVMAIMFIGLGYQLRNNLNALLKKNIFLYISLLILIPVCIWGTSMAINPKLRDWLMIPFSGIAGFILIYRLSAFINKHDNRFTEFLSFTGQNTLYVLTFHFLMFKPASLLKTYIYDLPLGMVGCHGVIWEQNEYFWIVYTVSSLLLSLAMARICHIKLVPIIRKYWPQH